MYIPANPSAVVQRKAAAEPWVAQAASEMAQAAEPWRKMSHDELWRLPFSATLPRSWSVLSNGDCPICAKPVPMYNWVIDPFKHPWKLACPHCKELFPKNDFGAYYESGLDTQNIFQYAKADASLLFNTEHPDHTDPLHKFAVDDGHGIPDGKGNLWRFIGTYLIYGRWKAQIWAGITKLANAFAVKGDIEDARRAGILLHRIADLYPSFDHKTQSVVEEKYFTEGFISTWHDACAETLEMALAYEIVGKAIENDETLRDFLSSKAAAHKLATRFDAPRALTLHIEEGIFRTAIREKHKIYVNYPGQDIAIMLMLNIMGMPEDRVTAAGMLDEMIQKSTMVDGVTGEKGLNAYSGYVLAYLAQYLSYAERAEPGAIARLLARHPNLRKTFRFHIDTWCLGQQYYPAVGDTSYFAAKDETYQPLVLQQQKNARSIAPSRSLFLWWLYEATGDAAYAQVISHANGDSVEGLPYDLLHPDAASLRQRLAQVIATHGPRPRLGNVLKDQWHLAILRSGEPGQERAAWMIYDTGGRHGHANGMNIGLFAKGLDLMPDMGYPTLQFANFDPQYAPWYGTTTAHNTVVIDGKDQSFRHKFDTGEPAALWADGKAFAAVKATLKKAYTGPDKPDALQYERTWARIDLSKKDSYYLDIFRVAGGNDHAKFQHSHFGTVATRGLSLKPAANFYDCKLMRAFANDSAPKPGWGVTWEVSDDYKYLPPGSKVFLNYIDLTQDAQASVCEAWVVRGSYDSVDDTYIKRVMVRRQKTAGDPHPLVSTFVALAEPHEGSSAIASVRRLALTNREGQTLNPAHICLEVTLTDGRRDVIAAVDTENPLTLLPAFMPGEPLFQRELGLEFIGELAWARIDKNGHVEKMSLARGSSLKIAGGVLALQPGETFAEWTR